MWNDIKLPGRISILSLTVATFILTVLLDRVNFDKHSYPKFLPKYISRLTVGKRKNSGALIKHEREMYAMVPIEFDPDFKAPCWFARGNRLMCLPYFYIAGFPKCGTTDLWNKVVQHPHVVSVCKEPHWWAWRHYGITSLPTCRKEETRKVTDKNDSSIEWFLEFYRTQGATNKIAKSNLSDATSFHPLVFGDASISTSYGVDGTFFSKYQLPNEQFAATVPKVLRSVTPNVRIIFILRDPVDRFYSGYMYNQFGRKHGTPQNFHSMTVDRIKCFQRCLQTHSLYYCGYHTNYCKSHGYLDRLPIGMYSIFIKDWLESFPRNQLHFITLNEVKNNPHTTLMGIFRFLDLPPFNIITDNNKPPANYRKYRAMLPKTRKMLQDFYRPFDKELMQLLGDKFSFSSLNVTKDTE